MHKTHYSRIILAIFLALILSAFNVASVFADESVPPEVAPTEEVTETPDEEISEEVSEVEVTEEVSEEETEAGSPSVAEIIESLPEDTDLIVLDEDGEALPLASEAAAEVLGGGDPQWCPVGVTPGAASCSPSFATFTGAGGLIEWLLNNQNKVVKAGVIWVEASYDSSSEPEDVIVLDGTLFSQPGASMDDFALTINGGWFGGNTKLINPNTPSIFNVPLNIIYWTGAITINNIVIEGASGDDETALWVKTTGNIVLNNVDVQNNTTEWAAYLENDGPGKGTVTVNDSTFNNNTGYNARGLEIYSNNTVTIKNITAMGNTYGGAYIDNSTANTPKPVTLNGTNHFSYNNGWFGLFIDSYGAITLSNITAVGNAEGVGVFLMNDHVTTKPAAVTIKGTNNFSENGWDGLRVYTYGAITISNITANDNGTDPDRPEATFIDTGDPDQDYYLYDAYGKGAFLYNYNWSPTGKPQPITITGTNTFNGNASTGLYVDSTGMVKINNLTANYNTCDSLKDLDDYGCAGAHIYGAGVTLTGYNFFIGNSNQGLEVYNNYVPSKNSTVGSLTLSNLYAEANGKGGVWAVNFGNYNVTITGTNVFNDNIDGHGLFVWSNGIVKLSNLTANYNDRHGVLVRNFEAMSPKAVVITGTNTFNGNKEDGLQIDSLGAITINNVTAMDNDLVGVLLDNCREDINDDDNDGEFNDCLAYSPQPVSMNGINVANGNGWGGISILSRGAITINNVTAEYNDAPGVELRNDFSNSVSGITQKGYAKVSNNYGDSGLLAFSNGAITLTNITADNNYGDGVAIGNNTFYVNLAKPANVTITGVNSFSGNSANGLYIDTLGAVVLSNITANENGDAGLVQFGTGVYIDNSSGIKAMPVTLSGNNTFNVNYGGGLEIISLGAIKVNNLMASFNEWEGARLENQFDLFSSPVTLSGYVIVNENVSGGLIVLSNGHVKTNNVTANNNEIDGVFIDTYWDAKPSAVVNVTMSGVNFFNGNDNSGLMIITDGAITLSNVTANSNEGEDVPAVTLLADKNITLNGSNTFNSNKGGGLYFVAGGNVVLTHVTANYNNDLVAGLPFSAGIVGIAGGNITINCGSLNFNEGVGYNLTVGSGKTITLKGVNTFGNSLGNLSTATPIITRTCPLP